MHVVVGENYRFGHAAEGDAATLEALGAKLGFGVTAVSLVTADGDRVSSSWIRELVRQGEVMHATRLLGRAPWLDGTVVRGFARGRALGVPTANLRWTPGPRRAGARHLRRLRRARPGGGERYPAAISVGGNPTFGDVEGTVVEAYLIGFDGDAYDRPMRVEFTRFLRHELAFESVEELVEQMWRDIETVAQARRGAGGGVERAARASVSARSGLTPIVQALRRAPLGSPVAARSGSDPERAAAPQSVDARAHRPAQLSSFDSSRSAR